MQFRATRCVCYALIMALVSTIAPLPLCTSASAQVMSPYSVGVVDFVNESGVEGDLLARLATDAVVVEMGKTTRYDVSITRSQIRNEMDKLDLHSPLSKIGLVRLGEPLGADAMLEGSIKTVQLAGTGVTRRASVTIVTQLIDQASGEIINGAVQSGTSSARVGYEADDDSLITEAISNAAFLAVKTMVDYIIPEATVMMNIKESQVMLNKGARDGIKAGMRLIVLRRKEIIGYLEVQSVSASDSMAKVTKSMRGVQPEDRVRAIFDMPTVSTKLQSAPLPSGAPAGGGAKSGTGSKIVKTLIAAAALFGLVSLFRGGRGGEDATTIRAGATPTTITWNASKYGHGQNVLEYQIIRDDFADGARPVRALRDPSEIDHGSTDLYRLYGTTADTNISYYRLDSNPATSYTEATWPVPYEDYGVTHTYQVRVLYKLSAGTTTPTDPTDTNGDTTTTVSKYYYTPVSNVITATAIEPVQVADIVSPPYDPSESAPEVSISELDLNTVNFEWNRKDGADLYKIRIEPVQAGQGLTWESNEFAESGPIVSLPSGERRSLVAELSRDSSYLGKAHKWRVYCRHQADSSLAWIEGESARFTVGVEPPPKPGS